MPRRRLPEPFVFLIDECLGRHLVPDAIRAVLDAGERAVVLPQGTKDLDWIPQAEVNGWVCFTKDRRLAREPNELRALLSARSATFMLGEASGEEHAARIARALPVVRRVLRVREVPLIARIEPDGSLLVRYEGGRELPSPRRVKPNAREREPASLGPDAKRRS